MTTIPLPGAAPGDAPDASDAPAVTQRPRRAAGEDPDAPPLTTLTVRQRLVDAVRLDLVGPWPGHPYETEQLFWPGDKPSSWYLTGFLVPATQAPDASTGDGDDVGFDRTAGDPHAPAEEVADEPRPAKRRLAPSSIGLSVLLPRAQPPVPDTLTVTVTWGNYVLGTAVDVDAPDAPDAPDATGDAGASSGTDGTQPRSGATTGATSGVTGRAAFRTVTDRTARPTGWYRLPGSETFEVPVPSPSASGGEGATVHRVPGSAGLEVHILARVLDAPEFAARVAPGTRAVSVFLVNNRAPDTGTPDLQYAFQAGIGVRSPLPFTARPDLRGSLATDWDDKVADLHYARTGEFATGHGVACDWDMDTPGPDGMPVCTNVRTTWIPDASVEKTRTEEIAGVELSMEALGALGSPDAVRTALLPLVTGYREWITAQQATVPWTAGNDPGRTATAGRLLFLASNAAGRIQSGIDLLCADPDALDAFRVANQAVARALSRRLREGETPRWRAFQLAFILLNIPGIARPGDPMAGRETVDLLFFPTGGGKTEAYLGLAAFTIVLRRLRNPADGGRCGAGVAVIMRYTLRLLTLDQLGRAAALVCALELIRETDAGRYGEWPFEIGLWVGKAATPNVLGRIGDTRPDSALAKLRAFQRDPGRNPGPVPLENCPWCGERFTPDSFSLVPSQQAPTDLRIRCVSLSCDFNGSRSLPIVAVDEPVYRRLPAFLIATVDKFASLPWTGASGALLGGADRHGRDGFYGGSEPGTGELLATPLLPPDLVIQDELHLITGPLGTMAGLYETAIEALCVRDLGGDVPGMPATHRVRPKIVASTATVRQASTQVQALFGRPDTRIFPPPGPDRRDSFFARTVTQETVPARQYLGIAAPGISPKVVMRRVWLALMGAAQKAYLEAGANRNADNPADPYMTVLGYFNSLRELGGARRIIEEEVQSTLSVYGRRVRAGGDPGLFASRDRFNEVVELTSRVTTDKIASARRRLESPYRDPGRVDGAIATNMISVGLDIPRLGLMVVMGQPIATAEYIQATSRIGRDDRKPGLVVTLLNVHRPRDRSHYERFRHFHETFYRSVEVGSVTPFASRALDRGLAGTVVTLARHRHAALAPSDGAERLAEVRDQLEADLLRVFRERLDHQGFAPGAEREARERSVHDRIVDLLDSWVTVVADYRNVGARVRYQQHEGTDTRKPLLRDMLETRFDTMHHRKFRVNRSLRDVEPEVHVFVRELGGLTIGNDADAGGAAMGDDAQ